MTAATFNRALLRMFGGPLVWAAHFLFIYGFTGIACARRNRPVEWLGVDIVAWAVSGATLIALATILVLLARTSYRGKPCDCSSFIHWMTLALGGISLLAIGWETVPVLLVPACR
jgi:hypothetical protein